jgi:hypothetical protein
MNTFVKAAIAGVLSLGATSAFANIGDPWSNSSDLVLVVENATTHNAYALDLGITLDQLLPTGSLVTGAVLNTSIQTGINKTIAASGSLQSFLSANPAAGDLWTLEGGQYAGSSANTATSTVDKVAGAGKMVITSAIGSSNNNAVKSKILSNMNSYLNGIQSDIHAPPTPPGLSQLETTTETNTATVSSDISAEARYGFLTANDFSNLGSTAQQLFGFTGNGGTGTLQSYILGTATLGADGTFSITTPTASPVPLPAAVWLFGSGLLGLFGVSRRRTAAA